MEEEVQMSAQDRIDVMSPGKKIAGKFPLVPKIPLKGAGKAKVTEKEGFLKKFAGPGKVKMIQAKKISPKGVVPLGHSIAGGAKFKAAGKKIFHHRYGPADQSALPNNDVKPREESSINDERLMDHTSVAGETKDTELFTDATQALANISRSVPSSSELTTKFKWPPSSPTSEDHKRTKPKIPVSTISGHAEGGSASPFGPKRIFKKPAFDTKPLETASAQSSPFGQRISFKKRTTEKEETPETVVTEEAAADQNRDDTGTATLTDDADEELENCMEGQGSIATESARQNDTAQTMDDDKQYVSTPKAESTPVTENTPVVAAPDDGNNVCEVVDIKPAVTSSEDDTAREDQTVDDITDNLTPSLLPAALAQTSPFGTKRTFKKAVLEKDPHKTTPSPWALFGQRLSFKKKGAESDKDDGSAVSPETKDKPEPSWKLLEDEQMTNIHRVVAMEDERVEVSDNIKMPVDTAVNLPRDHENISSQSPTCAMVDVALTEETATGQKTEDSTVDINEVPEDVEKWGTVTLEDTLVENQLSPGLEMDMGVVSEKDTTMVAERVEMMDTVARAGSRLSAGHDSEEIAETMRWMDSSGTSETQRDKPGSAVHTRDLHITDDLTDDRKDATLGADIEDSSVHIQLPSTPIDGLSGSATMEEPLVLSAKSSKMVVLDIDPQSGEYSLERPRTKSTLYGTRSGSGNESILSSGLQTALLSPDDAHLSNSKHKNATIGEAETPPSMVAENDDTSVPDIPNTSENAKHVEHDELSTGTEGNWTISDPLDLAVEYVEATVLPVGSLETQDENQEPLVQDLPRAVATYSHGNALSEPRNVERIDCVSPSNLQRTEHKPPEEAKNASRDKVLYEDQTNELESPQTCSNISRAPDQASREVSSSIHSTRSEENLHNATVAEGVREMTVSEKQLQAAAPEETQFSSAELTSQTIPVVAELLFGEASKDTPDSLQADVVILDQEAQITEKSEGSVQNMSERIGEEKSARRQGTFDHQSIPQPPHDLGPVEVEEQVVDRPEVSNEFNEQPLSTDHSRQSRHDTNEVMLPEVSIDFQDGVACVLEKLLNGSDDVATRPGMEIDRLENPDKYALEKKSDERSVVATESDLCEEPVSMAGEDVFASNKESSEASRQDISGTETCVERDFVPKLSDEAGGSSRDTDAESMLENNISADLATRADVLPLVPVENQSLPFVDTIGDFTGVVAPSSTVQEATGGTRGAERITAKLEIFRMHTLVIDNQRLVDPNYQPMTAHGGADGFGSFLNMGVVEPFLPSDTLSDEEDPLNLKQMDLFVKSMESMDMNNLNALETTLSNPSERSDVSEEHCVPASSEASSISVAVVVGLEIPGIPTAAAINKTVTEMDILFGGRNTCLQQETSAVEDITSSLNIQSSMDLMAERQSQLHSSEGPLREIVEHSTDWSNEVSPRVGSEDSAVAPAPQSCISSLRETLEMTASPEPKFHASMVRSPERDVARSQRSSLDPLLVDELNWKQQKHPSHEACASATSSTFEQTFQEVLPATSVSGINDSEEMPVPLETRTNLAEVTGQQTVLSTVLKHDATPGVSSLQTPISVSFQQSMSSLEKHRILTQPFTATSLPSQATRLTKTTSSSEAGQPLQTPTLLSSPLATILQTDIPQSPASSIPIRRLSSHTIRNHSTYTGLSDRACHVNGVGNLSSRSLSINDSTALLYPVRLMEGGPSPVVARTEVLQSGSSKVLAMDMLQPSEGAPPPPSMVRKCSVPQGERKTPAKEESFSSTTIPGSGTENRAYVLAASTTSGVALSLTSGSHYKKGALPSAEMPCPGTSATSAYLDFIWPSTSLATIAELSSAFTDAKTSQGAVSAWAPSQTPLIASGQRCTQVLNAGTRMVPVDHIYAPMTTGAPPNNRVHRAHVHDGLGTPGDQHLGISSGEMRSFGQELSKNQPPIIKARGSSNMSDMKVLHENRLGSYHQVLATDEVARGASTLYYNQKGMEQRSMTSSIGLPSVAGYSSTIRAASTPALTPTTHHGLASGPIRMERKSEENVPGVGAWASSTSLSTKPEDIMRVLRLPSTPVDGTKPAGSYTKHQKLTGPVPLPIAASMTPTHNSLPSEEIELNNQPAKTIGLEMSKVADTHGTTGVQAVDAHASTQGNKQASGPQVPIADKCDHIPLGSGYVLPSGDRTSQEACKSVTATVASEGADGIATSLGDKLLTRRGRNKAMEPNVGSMNSLSVDDCLGTGFYCRRSMNPLPAGGDTPTRLADAGVGAQAKSEYSVGVVAVSKEKSKNNAVLRVDRKQDNRVLFVRAIYPRMFEPITKTEVRLAPDIASGSRKGVPRLWNSCCVVREER